MYAHTHIEISCIDPCMCINAHIVDVCVKLVLKTRALEFIVSIMSRLCGLGLYIVLKIILYTFGNNSCRKNETVLD